jgi:hypothetical protein
MGVPGALGEQKCWRTRSGSAGACANESTERARLAEPAGLPVARAAGAALTAYNRSSKGSLSVAAIAFTANRCARFLDQKRNQRESGHAIQPPPIEQSCRRQADH